MTQEALQLPTTPPYPGAMMVVDVNKALATLASNSAGDAEPGNPFPHQWWAHGASGWMKQRNAANSAWINRFKLADAMGAVGALLFAAASDAAARSALSVFSAGEYQTQIATRFTAIGTADAMTGALAPVIDAYADGLRVTCTPPGANTLAAPTLGLHALGGKKIFKRAPGGAAVALAAGDYNGSGPFDFEFVSALDSGVGGWVLLNPIQQQTQSDYVPVRQTVLSGPVDANGYSAFGGATGSTTVTASGTLRITAAAGDANVTASKLNPSWTALSVNGTMYLYIDITNDGVITTGSTPLQPVYQFGGPYGTANNQHTFNIQEMVMKVGDGSVVVPKNRVFVGQVTVAGGVVTAIVWYALKGRFESGVFNFTNNTTYSKNHNIGVPPEWVRTARAMAYDGSKWHPGMVAYQGSGYFSESVNVDTALSASIYINSGVSYSDRWGSIFIPSKFRFYVERAW